ncbi:RagB/SusD family nutrient uptake outer membrane protein [Sediminibacterium soli]|uniref:RagB/SusD family nutrient uptake outer membrane protein n=1 Tax=Sediminibacterium soli TaxID=2698829 RepID=UPI00137A0995|nr:RagB/SusD family nutrient uptake outer membrane protein [Sediminibacterium soli]NCI45405.1 RagB/SusD family nutrient uptake outer membrane protein [Sediminibacterium soli]
MKTNQYIYLLLGVLVSFQLGSCKKDLAEVAPQDAISKEQVLSDPNAALTLYNGLYSLMRSNNATLFQLGEMRSEIWTDGLFTESADAGLQNLSRHNISALNVPFANWGGFYNMIYNLNNLITLFPKTQLSQANKDRMMAEAYGLRAYLYYTMVRTWGDVPLTTTPIQTINNTAETYKARTPADSVMMQVKKDIESSLQLFGSSNTLSTDKRVYWNRVATLVLKGDVYIWSGTHMNGGATDFTTAMNVLQEVQTLQGSSLQLNANYTDIFDPAKKANNRELIFAINYEIGQSTMGAFSSFQVNAIQAATLSLAQAPTPLVSATYPYVNGANRVGMNAAMITKLTGGAADQRISNSFKVLYSNSSPYAVRGVLLSKWLGSTSGTSQVYNNDYPVYRYADVLLLLAEAKAKLGADPSTEINLIRQRAYGAGFTPYVSGSLSANMDAILDEYQREFIGEGRYWWAMRRAGDSYVYARVNPAYLSASTTAKLLLPISVSMLNNDPLLQQTKGY